MSADSIPEEGKPIRIRHVTVQSAGPLRQFDRSISPLTVIHAPNETGKTTLVENIIASLFKRGRGNDLGLRGNFISPSTKITLSGTGNSEYSPASINKLDTFIEVKNPDVPPRLLQLLYVRASETGLTGKDGGIDTSVIKDLLSPHRKMLTLSGKVPAVMKKSGQLVNGQVMTNNQGLYNDYSDTLSRITEFSKASDSFYNGSISTRLTRIEKEIVASEIEIEKLGKARRHRAWKLQQKIISLKKTPLAMVSRDAFSTLQQVLGTWSTLSRQIEKKRDELEGYSDVKESITWLEAARQRYTGRTSSPLSFLLQVSGIVAGIVLGICGIGLVLLGKSAPGALLFGGSIMFTLVTLLLMKTMKTSSADSVEMNGLRQSFLDRYGHRCNSFTDIETMLQMEKNREAASGEILRSLNELEKNRNGTGITIQTGFSNLGRPGLPESNWYATLEELSRQKQQLDLSIESLGGQLTQLAVDPADYHAEDPGIEWSPTVEARVLSQLQDYNSEYQQVKEQLQQLLAKLGRMAGEDLFAKTLEQVHEILDTTHTSLLTLRREQAATLCAQYILQQTIDEFSAREEQKLEEYCNDPGMIERLYSVTGRYNRIKLLDDTIFIGTDNQLFPIQDLSTGAREQVLLSLRMGIAERLCGNRPMFMLLDDAFQHTDWQRREGMVQSMVSSVATGWQVIYFTMDDHIRDLFKNIGKRLPKNSVSVYTLT
jgi:hypothetical protein